VLIDGVLALDATQETDWQTMTVSIPEGHHTVSWRFTRKVGNDINQLQTFIDSIRFSLVDADNDGMPADWELAHGLDPDDPSDASEDPDSDGLTNLGEYQNGTQPFDSDSDDDGLPDGWEVSFGLDPLRLNDQEDPDGDGATNIAEYQAGTDPTDAASVPSSGGGGGGNTGGGGSGGGSSSGGGGGGGAVGYFFLLSLLLRLSWRLIYPGRRYELTE
jgi:uncharacterized membrane protein YgcG